MGALQRWLGRRRESGFLSGVLIPVYVTLAALAVAAAVGCALWKQLEPGANGDCSLHVGAALAGSAEVFSSEVAPGCRGLDLDEARATIVADFAFVALYAVGGSLALWWLWPRAWRTARLRRRRGLAFLPLAAGAFDLLENVFVLAGLEDGLALRDLPARAAAVAGWWKWMLVVSSALVTIGCICAAAGNRRIPATAGSRAAVAAPPPVRDEVGICLSGGGIRGAGFALGALRALDRRGLLRGARWLAAASGGAYAAGAWYVGRGTSPEAASVRPQPREGFDGLLDSSHPPSLFEYLRSQRRYLSTGRGGASATIVTGAALVAVNLLVLAAVVCLVAWPLGRLAATWAVQPGLRTFEYAQVSEQSLAVPVRLWLPGGAGVALAAVAWLVSLTLWDPARTRVLRLGGFFAAGGVVLVALLVGLPVAVTEIPKAWEALHPNPLWGAGLAMVAGIVGVAAAAGRLVVRPRSVWAGRIGGALLVLVALLLALRVAADAAYGDGWFRWSPGAYAVALAAFSVLYLVANAQSWSAFRLYYLRLRSTFATTQKPSHKARGAPGRAGVYPLSLEAEAPWHAYRGRTGPELVVCAAARRGRDAVPVTFSPSAVSIGLDEAAPEAYFTRLPRFGRWGPRLDSVSAATALSGAALTTARGAPSSFLAALNVRLGAWLPNPLYGDGPPRKPRLAYLLKEIAGRFEPDDPYLYVTDAGLWDGLGLVELVRRRPQWIVCVDAGDPGDFGVLERAIARARAECGAEILIDVEPLRRREGRLPQTSVTTGVIRYHTCGGTGRDACPAGLLFYGKAQVAADSRLNALSFSLKEGVARRSRGFGWFLPEDEFVNLVRLGEGVGRGLALEYERRRW
ncbi:MAG TPA: hypothetical protein VHN37_09915 [Actinomycetota bacterium]|nr:hypothetical protein [Actinomycetota bacterium]